MGQLSLVAENVHITYRTYLDPQVDLRSRLKSRGDSARRRHIEIKAVRGVSFDLHRGESLGIVGHNGAGKSTILLGLAGLMELNQGRVISRSRPRLLGVGSVLNTSLSGRRNIEIGCLAMGMPRDVVANRMDELIEFSGLEEFIDMPLKAYSSGMKARLSFTVATVSEPDILLIDEALAVGDVDFRVKAAERLEEIRKSAGSVVLVSHNTAEISRMCDRVIWLDKGVVVRDGSASRILRIYNATKADPKLLDTIVSTEIAGIGPLMTMSLSKLFETGYGAGQITETTFSAREQANTSPRESQTNVVSDLGDASETQAAIIASMLDNNELPTPSTSGADLDEWMLHHPSGALMMEWHSATNPRQAILLAETASPWFPKWYEGWDENEDGDLTLDQQPPRLDEEHELIYCSTRFPEYFLHWWIDVATRVYLALNSPELDGLKFILPAETNSFQKDALAALGIPENRIYTPSNDIERIKKIHFPGSTQSGSRSATSVDPNVLAAAKAARRSVLPDGPSSRGTRLYVSRRNDSTRRIRNETEVESTLSRLGFSIICPEDLPFAETVETFAEAELVVGVTGDGLANIVFCDPGTTVVEILPDTFVSSHLKSLSALGNLRHVVLAGRAFGEGRFNSKLAIDDNLRVPIDRLINLLDSEADQQLEPNN